MRRLMKGSQPQIVTEQYGRKGDERWRIARSPSAPPCATHPHPVEIIQCATLRHPGGTHPPIPPIPPYALSAGASWRPAGASPKEKSQPAAPNLS
jgi:hypothetical protein